VLHFFHILGLNAFLLFCLSIISINSQFGTVFFSLATNVSLRQSYYFTFNRFLSINMQDKKYGNKTRIKWEKEKHHTSQRNLTLYSKNVIFPHSSRLPNDGPPVLFAPFKLIYYNELGKKNNPGSRISMIRV